MSVNKGVKQLAGRLAMIRLGAFLLGSVLLIGCDSEHIDAAQGLPAQKLAHEVSITDLRPARQKLDQTLSV
ncbi:hypothetical protein, partial [Reinekea sp.]